ncbi:GNAT family N-acetyltransferase [Spirulina sp.]|uniref:GNAT family N-acetyltransferase n=1 Tax=Spirulina sp. TaxID=1157 RepID=UPI003F6FE85F
MTIRVAIDPDFDQIWPFWHAIVAAGETYAYPRQSTKQEAYQFWIEIPQHTYVEAEADAIHGSYYIKPNQPGPGGHVCNCGYMVAPAARGRGVATRLCQHSLQVARELGYKAMQFNSVVATNTGAVRLWERLGFAIVGRIPQAYDHATLGYVDLLVMYQWWGD